MRIRCPSCRKRISIDDAFAGGVCRCPYCTATVFVPGGSGDMAQQERPETPDAQVETTTPVEADQPHYVPTANPVHVQGIVAIVVTVLLILMIAGGIVLWRATRSEPAPPQGPAPDLNGLNPFAPGPAEVGGANIAGIRIEGPVVYCLDNGTAMRRSFDFVAHMVELSIQSLGDQQRFTILLCARPEAGQEQRVTALPGGWQPGGMGGVDKADAFLGEVVWFGDSDIPATIAKALERKARTIVVCGRALLANPEQLGRLAKEKGSTIATVSITDDEDITASLKRLAESSGGQSRAFTLFQLEAWYNAAPRLD